MVESSESAINMETLKVSAAAGLACGLGSLALFYIMSGDGDSKDSTQGKKLTKEQQKGIEKEEAEELKNCEQMLIDELEKEPNAPELIGGEGDLAFTFTKDFTLKVTRFIHKYHLIVGHMLTKQFEDKRLAAIEADDDIEYSRAFFGKNISQMRQALNIEDLIFDYFGIMEAQFEASNQYHKAADAENYTEAIKKLRDELTKQVEEEFQLQNEKALSTLTREKTTELKEKIRDFTTKVIRQASVVDQASGQQIIQLGDQKFELLHQKEKDKFYMESGFTVDQINKHFAKIEKHRKLVNDTDANDMRTSMA